ncbi:MAG: hypothetical protein HYT70_00275 [Candidatus Aenigmarchaeota archaeon]|nr:hypothetical protein [Candidatus Aenigmarchaeota archaeon]
MNEIKTITNLTKNDNESGRNRRLLFILSALAALLFLSIPALAETNVTLLYGWNGTAWIPVSVDNSGVLQTDLNLTESLSILPKSNNAYDLGASSLRWRDLYVARNAYLATTSGSVGIGTGSPLSTLDISGNLSVSGSTNSSIDISTLFIDATNNRVGIGTTSPSAALEVNGNLIAGTWINGTNFNATWINSTNLNASGTITANELVARTLELGWQNLTDYPGACTSGQFVSALGDSITCGSPTNNMTGYGTAGYVPLWFNTTSLNNSVIYQLGGNVGIGTTNPTQKLHVEGRVNITQNLTVGGNLTISGDILPSVAPITDLDISASGSIVMALGSDGFARIAYGETTTQDLKFIRCPNENCSEKVATTVESTLNVTTSSEIIAIALTSTDNAMIAYGNGTSSGTGLYFVQCTNADCSTNVKTTISTTNQVTTLDMRVGSNNFARIVYSDAGTLRYIECTNAACSTRTDNSLGGNSFAQPLALALNSTGSGKIIVTGPASSFWFIQCINAACSTNASTALNSYTGSTAADIEVASDGLPRILIAAESNWGWDYYKCTNANCTTNERVDLPGLGSGTASIDLDSNDLAIIVTSANVLRCTNDNCSTSAQNDVGGFGTINTKALRINDTSNLPRFVSIFGSPSKSFFWACKDALCENLGSSLGSNTTYFYRVYAHTFRGKQTTVDSFDVAEDYAVRDTTIGPGDVVIVSPNQSRGTGDVNSDIYVDKSSKPYQSDVIGVISTKPGVLLSDDSTNSQKRPVSLSGRVPVKISTENGPIAVGDLLTSSSTPGVAMKSTKAGRVIGVALESTDSNGKVIVFVNPHYWDGDELSKLRTENEGLRLRIYELEAGYKEMKSLLESLVERVGFIERR